MASVKTIDNAISLDFQKQLQKYGEDGLVSKILVDCQKTGVEHVENNLLDFSDAFFALFRRTGEDDFFILGKIFRRAAHLIYWDGLKKDQKPNYKFLTLMPSGEDKDGY